MNLPVPEKTGHMTGKPRGQVRPRLQDVAELAGASNQTVSRVVNNHANVSKATREKVQAAITKLGYRRNTAARSLVTGRSQIIGVIASNLAQRGTIETLLGVEQVARHAGYFVSITSLNEISTAGLASAVLHLTDQAVAGIVVLVPHTHALKGLHEMSLSAPIVVPGMHESTSVIIDQRSGARLAVEYLIGQGHRRIAHLSGPPGWTDSVERAAGWREALGSNRLSTDHLFLGDWSAGSGYTMGRIIAAERRITALFAGNDQMALGALRAFAEAAVKVPRDVSIVGFGDHTESTYCTPQLTTVRQDFQELGRNCMHEILQRLEFVSSASSQPITPRLVLRQSAAAPVQRPDLKRNGRHNAPMVTANRASTH